MCIERTNPALPTLRMRRDQGGITLIELIVFIVIVSVAVVGVLTVLNMTTAHSADPMIRKQMLAIAESLIEEVELQPFTVCVPDDSVNPPTPAIAAATTTAGCGPTAVQQFGYPPAAMVAGVLNRSLFNNVGNYCSNSGPSAVVCTLLTLASPILNLAGGFAPAGYSATIALTPEVSAATLGGITLSDATAAKMNVLRITVTVSHAGNDNIVLEGYRTRWAPALSPP